LCLSFLICLQTIPARDNLTPGIISPITMENT
jgi:hypothetical protein